MKITRRDPNDVVPKITRASGALVHLSAIIAGVLIAYAQSNPWSVQCTMWVILSAIFLLSGLQAILAANNLKHLQSLVALMREENRSHVAGETCYKDYCERMEMLNDEFDEALRRAKRLGLPG